MAKIVWMSQHAPTPRQLAALEEMYPHFDLLVDAKSFDTADDIVERFHASGADDLVVVAPWPVINELVNRGLAPLYAVMKSVPPDSPDVEIRVRRGRKDRCWRFIEFRRCEGINLKLSKANPIQPQKEKTPCPTFESIS